MSVELAITMPSIVGVGERRVGLDHLGAEALREGVALRAGDGIDQVAHPHGRQRGGVERVHLADAAGAEDGDFGHCSLPADGVRVRVRLARRHTPVLLEKNLKLEEISSTVDAGKATARDVAKAAGVSLSTVDRVLNGRGGVAADKERRVLEWARKLRLDRALDQRAARTLRIAVLIQPPENPFHAAIQAAFKAANRHSLFQPAVQHHPHRTGKPAANGADDCRTGAGA